MYEQVYGSICRKDSDVKEIRDRITKFVVICTLAAVLLTGTVSTVTANRIVSSSAAECMQMQCDVTGGKVNELMNSVESSVRFLCESTYAYIDSPQDFANDIVSMNNYDTMMTAAMKKLSESTSGSMAVYYRYNPDYTTRMKGRFFVRSKETKAMREEPPTDISAYKSTDIEHVGWYYEAVKAGGPVWIGPYHNSNINRDIMSYVVPIKIQGTLVGVIGMDVDFRYIADYIGQISIYDTGGAFSVSDGKILQYDNEKLIRIPVENISGYQELYAAVHSDQETSGTYTKNGKQSVFTSKDMNGGLHLVISAPTAEIYKDSYRLILLITVLMVASTAVILAISRPICTRIVQMAYTDRLTGLPNREYFRDIYDSRMKEKNIQSTMFMLDIDHFKMVNDTYGHAVGDKVLTAVAGEIRDIFGKNAILSRWGGDEFVGIIPSDGDLERCRELCQRVSEDSTEICAGGYTLSVGLYRIRENMAGNNIENMVSKADMALYEAKGVRNCAMVYNKMGADCKPDRNGAEN